MSINIKNNSEQIASQLYGTGSEKLKIIFIGTPEFGAIILNKLIKNGYRPDLVITNPNKPIGRGYELASCPVYRIAQKNNIKISQPIKIKECQQEIKKLNPDLGITIAYGQKLPEEILTIPKYGFINVHPSMLPMYRGSSPIKQSIINNDQETGVTIMLMNERIDQGPIIAQKKIAIKENITYSELSLQLAETGSDLLIETIPQWIGGKIKIKNQNNNLASYIKTMTKKDGKINWNLTASEIERKVRALNPWPGTYSFYKDKNTGERKMIKILEAEVQTQTKNGPFGPLGKVYMATNSRLAVQAKTDFLIIKKLQMENKNPVKTEEFINGNISFIGTILE